MKDLRIDVNYLCGLMQKMLCFLNRAIAKFVPMVKVAGSAGGTTMVMRSSALTMMMCHDSCFSSVFDRMLLQEDLLPA